MSEFKLWHAIEIPFYGLAGWSMVAVLFQVYVIQQTLAIGIIGLVLMVAAYSYASFLAIKAKQPLLTAVKAAALTGALVSLVGAVLNLISFYAFPQLFESAITQGIAAGATREQIMAMVPIQLGAGFIIGPIVGALLGALIGLISGLIYKKLIKN